MLGSRPRRKVRSITTATPRTEPLSSTPSNVQIITEDIISSADDSVQETDTSLDSLEVTVSDLVDPSSSSTTPPSSPEDIIETITDTFLSAISRDITETQSLQKDATAESFLSPKEKIQEVKADLTSFGKLTTEDPISALLSNVEIIDVRNFIPRGYRFSLKHVEEEKGKKVMMKEFSKNINDLLQASRCSLCIQLVIVSAGAEA